MTDPRGELTRVEEMRDDFNAFCGAFSDLPRDLVANEIISFVTQILLSESPNHLVAVKTIMASVQNGINEYQHLYVSKQKPKRKK